jgi:hypothetical protein
MKIKLKPWISLVIVAVLFGVVSEMDYQDQVKTEQATIAYRVTGNQYAGR